MPTRTLSDFVAEMKLVDGHCHSVFSRPVDVEGFELASTEADAPAPAGLSYLDSAVGLSIRRWCPPLLDLPVGTALGDYVDRRQQLGIDDVSRRLLGAAGLSHVLVDTGLAGSDLVHAGQLGALAGAEVREVVRLEALAESLASEGATAADFESTYIDALGEATRDAVAVKSVLAYRGGFAIDPRRPSPLDVRQAAGRWLDRPGPIRMDDSVLLRFLLWCGVGRGLPVQVHCGLGDRDLDLTAVNPALLQPFFAAVEQSGTPIVLLHCYPYQRQAGWLAAVYPNVYVDVGLTVAQVGGRADIVLSEFLELTPFGKLLFSTDGYALPELYMVAAAQFRHSLGKLLGAWVADGAIQPDDAERLAVGVGRANAEYVYKL